MIIDEIKKTATFELISTSELCPEDDSDVLIITKSGLVTIGKYYADEMGDYWFNNDKDSEDPFMCQDTILYWARLC